jgi:hypothetical protein
MPVITGTIKDSGGSVQSGTLRLVLDSAIVNESTSPNSTHIPISKDYTITSGVVNIDVPESATDNTTYRIQFLKSATLLSYFFANGDSYTGPKHYHSDNNWYTGAAHTSASVLLYEQSETRETVYLDFRAIIPNIPTVEFSALLPTGITTDKLDTSLRRLAEILTQNTSFINILRGGPRPKGDYVSTTYYQLGDAVNYGGSWWYFVNNTPAVNQTPSVVNTTYWLQISTKGDAGGTGGTDTAYNATGWNGATFAPTANAIRNKIETLAPLASPAFSGNPTAPTQLTSDNSTRIASTAFTQAILTGFLASPSFTGVPVAPTASPEVSNTQLATTAFVKSFHRYSRLSDTKSAGTAGGTSLAAATQIRALNTIETTSGDVTALSSNRFTLRTGTYRISASTTGYAVGAHTVRLYNVTGAITAMFGSSESAGSGTTTRSFVGGILTVASASDFEIRHYTTTAVTTNGLGLPVGLGVSEVYTIVEIWRVD